MSVSYNDLKEILKENPEAREALDYFVTRAYYSIIYDLLTGNPDITSVDINLFGLTREAYMVVVYEKYSPYSEATPYRLSDLLLAADYNRDYHDCITIDYREVILFKGQASIDKFHDLINRYYTTKSPQKGSPMDSLFIAMGAVVYDTSDIKESYRQAVSLLEHRFFCKESQHVIEYSSEYKNNPSTNITIDNHYLSSTVDLLVGYIQAFQRKKITDFFNKLNWDLYASNMNNEELKLFLADILLRVKEQMTSRYPELSSIIPVNGDIMRFILERCYYYEIENYFKEQFEQIMSFIGSSSSESVLEDIINYIDHNYGDDLTLEKIAPLFGYNSSYLGKIFRKKTGTSFNSYLDSIRIAKAKELLENENMKVYEIAAKVGYNNVDYFHIKFKKYVGSSPAEYKKKFKTDDTENAAMQ